MPLEKLNAALIGAIQNSTPEYTNAAAILTDKLNIGREAAYRRLRGEVPFTFGEAGVLSAQMNFSLDRTVGALDFGNVLFRLSFSDYHTALEDYTGVIDQDTLFYREVSSDVDAEQAIAGNSFPRISALSPTSEILISKSEPYSKPGIKNRQSICTHTRFPSCFTRSLTLLLYCTGDMKNSSGIVQGAGYTRKSDASGKSVRI